MHNNKNTYSQKLPFYPKLIKKIIKSVNEETFAHRLVVLNLIELATHFSGLKTLAAHLCLIKTKILVLMVIIYEIVFVFTCFLVYFKTWRHT